jgi:upstream activation factor subunit UAF30
VGGCNEQPLLSQKEIDNLKKPTQTLSRFAKPVTNSEELANFIGIDIGLPIARTHVTRVITQYIKRHNLQYPQNKKRIIPDASLAKLLNVTDIEEVTYFNLQKFLGRHLQHT